MKITITPRALQGTIEAIPSKSCAHRILICAAFASGKTKLNIPVVNTDIEATADCLSALGAKINHQSWGYEITPIQRIPEKADLYVKESGSTLRFLLPVVGALGVNATFHMEGRLPNRPLSPLKEEMERMGCSFSQIGSQLHLTGKLRGGLYRIAGNVSSQFVTGLLFTGAIRPDIELEVIGKLESKPYVDMTKAVIAQFGVPLISPGVLSVEGDWSNAAFFLTAKALGCDVSITGLDPNSTQGDRQISACLKALEEMVTISAADIPDLIPTLSVAAACKKGAVFTDIQRLRLKESDRVAAIISMIENLGGKAETSGNTLIIYGTGLTGGTVDSHNDHRIAMAAAIAATQCRKDVSIINPQAVNKSYPRFWEDYKKLGGKYEQYIR